MNDNIQTIKKLYAAAEGHSLDLETFLSCFSQDAYVRDLTLDRMILAEAAKGNF